MSAILTTKTFTIVIIIASLLRSSVATVWASTISQTTCFKSIISFGDSLTDTGNFLALTPSGSPMNFHLPPYGETFFHYPTGRCSDGRLVIDFIAESFGLPLLPPYLSVGEGSKSGRNFSGGVNFAVVGATALDDEILGQMGIINTNNNVSLRIELEWFKDFRNSVSNQSSDWLEFMKSSLVVMGEIGGNDYNYALTESKTEELATIVTSVIRVIGSAIAEIIEAGAVAVVVPGDLPIGCLPVYLTTYPSSNKDDYDMATGCLKWLNEFSEYHNELLQIELNRLRKIYPHATIIYADYYNAAMRFYENPHQYGFRDDLSACCGDDRAEYNYNESVLCGYPTSTCDDPSSYMSWDGMHLTEAAYRVIAQGILDGPYSDPPIKTSCGPSSISSSTSSTTSLLLQAVAEPAKFE